MEKVKLRLYQLTLILSLISFALALLSSGNNANFSILRFMPALSA